MARFSQDAKLIIILALILIAIGIIGSKGGQDSDQTAGMMPRLTTYSNRPFGVMALYKCLDRLKFHPSRNLRKLSSSLPNGVLFILNPELPLEDDEWKSLQAWVSQGNTLVFADNYLGLDIDFLKESKSQPALPVMPSFLSNQVKHIRVPLGTSIDESEWCFADLDARPALFRTLKKASRKHKPTDARSSVPMFAAQSNTSVTYTKWGKGSVIHLCSPWMLCNQGIAKDDNIVFILNVLSDLNPKSSVVFDEYHHGYQEDSGIMSLFKLPAKVGLGQIVLAFILLVFALSRRMGRPIPLVENKRTRSEYLGSMSSIFAKANAVDAAKSELDRQFLADLSRFFHLPASASSQMIIKAAADQHLTNYEELVALVRSTSQPVTDPHALLLLARRRYQLRKELVKQK